MKKCKNKTPTSDAVAQRFGVYNVANAWVPSASLLSYMASLLSYMDSIFNGTANYTYFIGSNSASEEMAFYGFKHNNSKGGIAIVMTLHYGIAVGKGSGLPSTWAWHSIINW